MPIKCYFCGEDILQGMKIFDIVNGVMYFFHVFPKECWKQYQKNKKESLEGMENE